MSMPETRTFERAVYACDIGRVERSAFAWARVRPDSGEPLTSSSDMHRIAVALRADAAMGISVALGFECPLFVPVPWEPIEIGRCRPGEGNRSFSVSAGLQVTVLGLQESAWVLRAVSDAFDGYVVTTDWRRWTQQGGQPQLLLWEAFVSSEAKSPTHEEDAITALQEFVRLEQNLEVGNAVTAAQPLSLIASAALWAGLSIEPALLRAATLVLRPLHPAR
jgi:hypothetical protein